MVNDDGAIEASDTWQAVQQVLAAAREFLDMDVAYVSEFTGGRQVFRGIEGDAPSFGMEVGGGDPLEGSYCIRVLNGVVPGVIPNVGAVPELAALEVTERARIAAYVGVPIRLSESRVYGMLCCLSHQADERLRDRDLRYMEMLAGLLAKYLAAHEAAAREDFDRRARIARVVQGGGPSIVYQPIIDLTGRGVVGYESLSRFSSGGGPDTWFADAFKADRGPELELTAIRSAVQGLAMFDEAYVAVNASPSTVLTGGLQAALGDARLERIVLEITEHAEVSNYRELNTALLPLRAQGLRLAVDDAGAGFASFQHILQMSPDIIKLDRSWTHDIDQDVARRHLVGALVGFAAQVGSSVLAEGIETEKELVTVRSLGISLGQGYFLGRPAPLAAECLTAPLRAGEPAFSSRTGWRMINKSMP